MNISTAHGRTPWPCNEKGAALVDKSQSTISTTDCSQRYYYHHSWSTRQPPHTTFSERTQEGSANYTMLQNVCHLLEQVPHSHSNVTLSWLSLWILPFTKYTCSIAKSEQAERPHNTIRWGKLALFPGLHQLAWKINPSLCGLRYRIIFIASNKSWGVGMALQVGYTYPRWHLEGKYMSPTFHSHRGQTGKEASLQLLKEDT